MGRALLAVMISVKLLPIVFVGFTLRNRTTLPWFAGGIVVCAIVSLLGAGVDAHLEYPGVLLGLAPYPASLAKWTGIPWIGYAICAVGVVAGYVLTERAAYALGLVALVLAAPGIGIWTPLFCLALAGPFGRGKEPLPSSSVAAGEELSPAS
jgi:hypothetical protein